MKIIKLLSAVLFCLSHQAFADDHSGDPDEDLLEDNGLEWQLSIGAFYADMVLPKLVGADNSPAPPTLRADIKLQYKNFYLVTYSGDFFGGSDIGYQFIQEEEWGLDIIYGSYQLAFTETGYFDTKDPVVKELKGIRDRDPDQSLGVAYYRSVGEYLAVAELVYDVFGDTNGWVFHLEATRNFELRNWDLWLNFGANYYSSNFNSYFYGVTEAEQNDYLTPYEPGSGASAFVQAQLSYPIAEDWEFSAGMSFLVGSSEAKDSPLLESNHARVLFTGVKYVF